jgi:uncharacterized protein YjbI with pentapeptide repeats
MASPISHNVSPKIGPISACYCLAVVAASTVTPPSCGAGAALVIPPEIQTEAIQCFRAGRTLDLDGRPDRKIDAAFLIRLLTDKENTARVHLRGVRIRGAEVTGSFDLENAEVPLDVRLETCRFTHPVRLTNTTFSKSLSFAGSIFTDAFCMDGAQVCASLDARGAQFESPVHSPVFTRLSVRGRADFSGAAFAVGASFPYTTFNGGLELSKSQFCLTEKQSLTFEKTRNAIPAAGVAAGTALALYFRSPDADLDRVTVSGDFALNDAVFGGDLKMAYARISKNLEADEARFTNKTAKVSLNAAKIDGSLFIRKAIFSGAADNTHLEVAINLIANGARFTNEAKTASFNTVKVGHYAYLDDALFCGPADFGFSVVGIDLYLAGAQFHERGQFNSITVGGKIQFGRRESNPNTKTVFHGDADFSRAKITVDFQAYELEVDKKASFLGLKTGARMFLTGAEFKGPADFEWCEIGGSIDATNAHFRDEKKSADFSASKIGQADFSKAVFCGTAVFTSTSYDLGLSLANARFDGDADLSGIRVKGPLTLTGTKFDGKVNLARADLEKVYLDKMQYRERRDGALFVWLSDMNYEYIEADAGREPENQIIRLLENANYWSNDYNRLEIFYRQQGYPEKANKVLYAHKARERQQLDWHSGWWWWLWSWSGNWIHYQLAGYGAHPEYAFWWALVVMAFGMCVFRPSLMEEKRATSHKHGYSSFLYSIDLFVPAISLEMEKHWRPKTDVGFVRFWFRFQRIAGWVLIPIGVYSILNMAKL